MPRFGSTGRCHLWRVGQQQRRCRRQAQVGVAATAAGAGDAGNTSSIARNAASTIKGCGCALESDVGALAVQGREVGAWCNTVG